MPLLASLIPMLVGFLVSAAASVVGSALIGLGIGLVTYYGFNELLQTVMQGIQTRFAVLPPMMITIMIKLKIDVCISILTSAGMIKLGLDGLRSGVVKRWANK